ncbi:MAG TPA: serine/threonine-protein kinase [Polyangiaceae bacterium]|nr:serine/threonine-protein kinase [Polyangiaceae bacterium]
MSDDDVLREATQRVGTVLGGKYTIDGVLGVGGMAVVYAATHRNRKRFAVKVLHAELSARRDIRARFLREGYVANSVRHPGVVAVLDDDVDADGSAFLVMELLEGATVDDLRSRLGGRLPVREALAVAHQLLDVLAVAHESAIIHRDIKPANLFVSTTGHVKVLDFGIARLRDAAAGVQSTRAGAIVGTPSFMAPEQALAQGDEIDPRTDVWAAGATLFTMLSGQFVHEGDNARQMMIKAATAPARSLADVAPDTPPAVVDLVAKALEFERSARWDSAAAMREAVVRIHQELFGAFSHDYLRACLEHAPCAFESARTEGPRGEAQSSAEGKEGVEIAPPAGTRPESPVARRLVAESDVATTTSKPVSNRGTQGSPRGRRTAVIAVVATVAGLGVGGVALKSVKESSQQRDMSAAATRVSALHEETVPPVAAPAAPAMEALRPLPTEASAASDPPKAPATTALVPSPRPTTASAPSVGARSARAPLPPPPAKPDALAPVSSADARPRDPLHIELQ